jgi:hypothetical protein
MMRLGHTLLLIVFISLYIFIFKIIIYLNGKGHENNL